MIPHAYYERECWMEKKISTYKSFHTMMEPCAGPHKDNRLAWRKREEKNTQKIFSYIAH